MRPGRENTPPLARTTRQVSQSIVRTKTPTTTVTAGDMRMARIPINQSGLHLPSAVGAGIESPPRPSCALSDRNAQCHVS
jgi:hypothetical protein